MRTLVMVVLLISMFSLVSALAGNNIVSQVRRFTVDNYYAPIVNNVTPVPATDPKAGNLTYIFINFTVTDTDGVGDLNDSTARVIFNKSTTQRIGNCTPNDLNLTATKYVCNVSMWYYDDPGTWAINVSVRDNMSYMASNSTTTFVYNTLSAISINLTELTFGTVYIRRPTGALNDPIGINNTGNVDFTNISLRAYDLVGATYSNYVIYANQFAASTSDAFTQVMQNNTFIQIPGASLNHGATALQNIYLWVNLTYDVQAQTYNSSIHGNWMIQVE